MEQTTTITFPEDESFDIGRDTRNAAARAKTRRTRSY